MPRHRGRARRQPRQWHVHCLVLLFLRLALFSLLSSPGPEGLHYGRYAPEGQLCCEMVIDIPFAVRFFVVDIPVVRVVQILPRRAAPLYAPTGALWFRLQKTADSPQLQFITVVVFPVVMPWLIPMVLVTTEIAQLLLDTVVNAPILHAVQVHIPVVARLVRMVLTLQQTIATPQYPWTR